MALMNCKGCGKEISKSARRCPHCGHYIWSTGRLGCASIFLFFFLAFIIGILTSR